MFAKPQLRLIFLSLFISFFSSVLLPMERTIKSTSKKYKEPVQEETLIESCLSDDEEDVDKAFIKSFEMHQDKKATKVDAAKQMKGESIEADRFKQEQDFHKRLIQKELIPNDAQAYYKKITPITSDPTKRTKNPANIVDQWKIVSVSIDGKEIDPNANDMYIDGDISFTIPAADFNPTQPLNIAIEHGERRRNTEFVKSTEEKIPGFPLFKSYNAVLDIMRNNDLSLLHHVTLEGSITIPGKEPCDILIEWMNSCEKSFTLQGMEIVCNENTRETELFFDFIDDANKPINYFNITTCKQPKITENNKVLCFKKNHKMYECDPYGFFDSPATRKSWVPNESNFYKLCSDQTQNKMTSLPSFYSNPDNAEKDPNEPVVWVFSEGNNSLYQLYGIPELKDTNDYLYCDEDSFFATLLYKATYRECFSDNLIELEYLVQVPKPHILIDEVVIINKGTPKTKWPAGIYKRTRNLEENSSCWNRIGAQKKDAIVFRDKGEIRTNVIWPTDPLTAQENKQYCDAAQRFFTYFSANIHHCNQEITNGLQQWNKLTQLNLSKLQLENDLTWNNVLHAVGTMTQLTSLHFENNHPIADLMDKSKYHQDLAYEALYCYNLFALCLTKLTKLKELHIQGLWLKPCRYLGVGCEGLIWVSTEVATLTGIINHEKQAGVKAVVKAICTLPSLENLSIDGIPNHGSCDFARKTYGQRIYLAPFLLPFTLMQICEGYIQEEDLKQLVITTATQLASRPHLGSISVYSPGDNCIDYFSRTFRDRLQQAKQTLNVIPKELQ